MGIADVIQHYHPEWQPPADNGREWIKCLCPWHEESNPSATVSYDNDAFKCFGCSVKGDVIKIIRMEERCSYGDAVEIAARISPDSDYEVPRSTTRKPVRRVFGGAGPSTGIQDDRGQQVPSGFRGRPSPWS